MQPNPGPNPLVDWTLPPQITPAVGGCRVLLSNHCRPARPRVVKLAARDRRGLAAPHCAETSPSCQSCQVSQPRPPQRRLPDREAGSDPEGERVKIIVRTATCWRFRVERNGTNSIAVRSQTLREMGLLFDNSTTQHLPDLHSLWRLWRLSVACFF